MDEIDSNISHILNFASKKGIYSYFLPLPEPKPSYCPAVMPNSWIIGPDGSVYKCTLLLDLEDRVGDLDDSGNITFEKKIDLWLKYEFEDDRKCLNCTLLPVCYGGCPNARFGRHRGCLCSMETARKPWFHTTYPKGGGKEASRNDNFARSKRQSKRCSRRERYLRQQLQTRVNLAATL